MVQLSLLDRIDDVKVDETSLISSEDEAVCQEFQSRFYAFMDFTVQFNQFVDEKGSNFEGCGVDFAWRNPQAMKKIISEQFSNALNSFSVNVVAHFRKTYGVTVSSDGIAAKYGERITYQDIVREVLEQLGGLNFKEKALAEVEDAFRRLVRHSKVTVKGSKFSADDLLYWDDQWCDKGTCRPSSDDKPRKTIFKALSQFESGSASILPSFVHLCEYRLRNDWFEKNEFKLLRKITGFKFYKNGRIDIHFATPELARQFANAYAGREV